MKARDTKGTARAALRLLLPFVVVTTGALVASAQPSRKKTPATPPPPPTASASTRLRSRVGVERASALVKSGDPAERIRGIERAAEIDSPEALAVLVDAEKASASPTAIRNDSRALLALARALARRAEQDRARDALKTILSSGTSGAGRASDGDLALRTELARATAAIALARSGDRGLEIVRDAARVSGSGQTAALVALALYPPRDPGFFGNAQVPAPIARLLGRLGDLRALDVLHASSRSTDATVRGAAIVALAELGDDRAVALARAAIVDPNPTLREAAGDAFVLLNAPERLPATTALIGDEATTAIGLHLAERVHSPEITKLVAARAAVHPRREIRVSAIRALGTSPDPGAAKALLQPEVLADPELAFDAASALARSPAPNAGSLLAGMFATAHATLAARAYVVRALVLGERTDASDDAVARMATAGRTRPLGVFVRVALGDADVRDFLADADARVRRAAASAAMARPPARDVDRALLERLAVEPDPATREVLALGLRGGDPDGRVKTSVLVERAESGGGDAPLAAFALACRVDDATVRKVAQLLASKDPTVRAHAARGLAEATLPDASGRLAEAYAYETDVDVRRAVVEALAARTADAGAPARSITLHLAAELDPDGPVRLAARRALAGTAAPFGPAARTEVAWLRLPGARPTFTGAVVRPDGLAVPIAFDDEGFAVVPGLPPGEDRLVLAPRLPTDETSGRSP